MVVDRLVIKDDIKSRLSDSVETAASLSGGIIYIDVIGGEELHFSQSYACEEHGVSMPELTPAMFSFNSPFGACPTCSGLGVFMKIDERLIIADEDKSLLDGAIQASGWGVNSWTNPNAGTIAVMYYEGLARHFGFDINTPFKNLPEDVKNAVKPFTLGADAIQDRSQCISDTAPKQKKKSCFS